MKSVSSLIERKDNNLKDIYLSKLNNEYFREVVSLINTSQDKLYKHTSKIENSSCEYKNCMVCKGLSFCKNELLGYCNLPVEDGEDISFMYKACKFKQREIEKNKYKDNLDLFSMPKNLKDARIKDIFTDDSSRNDAIRYILEFLKKYKKEDIKGLYLHGNFGCGKTYLVAALFNELAKKGERCAIIYLPEFLRELKSSFKSYEDDFTFGDKYEYIKNIPYLLIDDVGAENVTAWGRDEILGTLLQHRMNDGLVTFFTSNLTIEELEVHLSASQNKTDKVKARRIIERIKCLTNDIEIIGKSRR